MPSCLQRGLPALGTLLVLGICCAGAASARAESITNAQLLYGWGFDDTYYEGRNTEGETETTVTLEHYGPWKYGANFFFFDVLHGDFLAAAGEPVGKTVAIYGEWASRVSAFKVFGREASGGWLRDVYLAGEMDVGGDGFWAGLAGVGAEIALPYDLFLGGTVSYRDDRFNAGTYQVTAYWGLPLAILKVPLFFTGFIDVAGTDRFGADVLTQPQLLVDVGALAGWGPSRLQAGCELYLHYNEIVSTAAPQAMVKWLW